MTLEQARKSFRRDETPFVRTPRLRLKPKAPRSGYVDGAWWPRSDDLTTELADLMGVMSFRLGVIDRVTHNLGEWTGAPAELATGGRAVHLDGDQRHQPTPSKSWTPTATRSSCWSFRGTPSQTMHTRS